MANTDSIDATHPLYDCRLAQWRRCRDCWDGQEAIKRRDHGRCYLPPTDGMVLDGAFTPDAKAIGWTNYRAYLNRALFYGFYADAVTMALGLAWTKEPIFEGLTNTPLEYLIDKATHEGESLCRLLYRINENQMGVGRLGLLADMPAGETAGKPQPYISLYTAEACINWDASFQGELAQEKLNLVVLNESGPRRTGTFGWEECEQYRVLTLGPVDTNEVTGVYRMGVFAQSGGEDKAGTPMFEEESMLTPSIQGRQLDEIPFVFCNSTSATSCPVDPPLLSLADLALSLYQIGADYHQGMHAACQATAVTKGLKKAAPGEQEIRLGAGGHISLGDSPNVDAFFLEIEGKGIPELRQAVSNAKDMCSQRAGEVVDQSSRGRESGNALEQRISVRTANLGAVVESGAHGLQKLLRIMGKWLGMTEAEVSKITVRPNRVFAKKNLSAIELKSISETMAMRQTVISAQAVHNYLVQAGFTELPWEAMVQQFKDERPLMKELFPEPPLDLTKTGGSNGGPAILPASTGF